MIDPGPLTYSFNEDFKHKAGIQILLIDYT